MDYCTVQEVGRYLCANAPYVKDLLAKGMLLGMSVGDHIKIYRPSVVAFKQSQDEAHPSLGEKTNHNLRR